MPCDEQAGRLSQLVGDGLPAQLDASELEELTRTPIAGGEEGQADLPVFDSDGTRIADVFVGPTEFGIELQMRTEGDHTFRPLPLNTGLQPWGSNVGHLEQALAASVDALGGRLETLAAELHRNLGYADAESSEAESPAV
jgi:hypothetical protein